MITWRTTLIRSFLCNVLPLFQNSITFRECWVFSRFCSFLTISVFSDIYNVNSFHNWAPFVSSYPIYCLGQTWYQQLVVWCGAVPHPGRPTQHHHHHHHQHLALKVKHYLVRTYATKPLTFLWGLNETIFFRYETRGQWRDWGHHRSSLGSCGGWIGSPGSSLFPPPSPREMLEMCCGTTPENPRLRRVLQPIGPRWWRLGCPGARCYTCPLLLLTDKINIVLN